MITAGIDSGAKTVKVVLLKDNKILAKSIAQTGFDTDVAVKEAFGSALKTASITEKDINHITSTGAGRKKVRFTNSDVTEVSADCKGTIFLHPQARTVIDVGAEEARGIKCNEQGKVIDFATNEKCAAGAGAFTEAMARALEISLEELGKLSLRSTKPVPMNAQCTVFAESEVVSLIHAKTSKEDIARAILDAIANRVASMVSRIGLEKDAVLIGGVARNIGFRESLKRILETEVVVVDEPEYVGALGSALIAQDNLAGR